MIKITLKEIKIISDLPELIKKAIEQAAKDYGFPITIKNELKALKIIETEDDISNVFMSLVLDPMVKTLAFKVLKFQKTISADYMIYSYQNVVFTAAGLKDLQDNEIKEFCRQKGYPTNPNYIGSSLTARLMIWKKLAVALYDASGIDHDLVVEPVKKKKKKRR